MKKRLLAMLLVLMLVVSLLPTGALADDASQQSEKGYFTISYQNEGLYDRTIKVTLLLNDTVLDKVTVSDAILGSQNVTVSLNAPYNSQYDIENVDISGCDAVAPSLLADSYSAQVSNISENAPANIYIHLIEYEAPEVDEEIGGQGFTRTYRIYDDQIYKILHFEGVEVSAETEIVSVTPLWVRQFGTESNKGLIKEYRENDYWDNSFTSDSADVDEVQPGNIKGISIEYNNGSENKKVTVSSGDLRVLTGGISGSKYYVIELNNDSFHIVYFYNEPGAQVINNYELYDVRFVKHNGNLVGNMPTDPTYPPSSYYEFVAWTYDYNAGRPFLETTTVSEDITVYAQKRTTTSNNSWIYVMNDSNLLKERITELYNEADVDWDSVKITVYSKDDEHTNPDYNLGQYNGNGWRDNGGYYHVYNYLSGVGDQQNESIAINNISKIVITANDISGNDLGPVTIEKGIYDGDFWVSAGNTAAQYIAYIYINDNGVEDPDEGGEEPEPEPDPEEPRDPTDTELGKLAVVLKCTNGEVEHDEKTKAFHLRTTNSKCEIQQVGEEYICSVTPDYDKILSTYNTATKATHEYEDEGKQFVLTWNASTNAWDVASDPSITRQVKCETPEQPTMYEIYVTVHNGTATFRGSEVTSYILAAENEDITITFTPDEGYTLDYATIDGNMLLIPDGGVYTLKQVDKDHTIEVFYAEDKLGGGDDGNEPDGTPDYRQVFVKYVAADENGSVTPSFNTFNLEVDENGKVMTEAGLRLSGVATPNADATFAYWTIEGLDYDGGAYSYEADLSGKGFTGYVAGQTYTFTAYFNGPVVKPEQPGVYKIYVTVHNGTATFYGIEVTSYILADENEDITITFTPDEGYTLDYATIDGKMLQIPDNGVYTLKQVDRDHTIEVFYESDKIGTEDPNEGDGVPDKYQATVNFVAGENGEVTGDVTKVYTIFGADGKYAEEGVITPSLEGVTVTPDEGYKVDGWTNAAGERVDPESEITVEGGDVVVFTVNFQSDPSLKEITSFEKKLVTDRKTYHSFGLRVPTFIRNGSTVVVDEGKGVTLLYAISLTGTPGAEYAITDTGADVADGYALTGVIPETGVVTVYVTKDFTWREAAAAAYKDDALVNTAAVELTDNPNEPGQESTETVDVDIDWDYNPPVVDDDDDDDEDEDDDVFVPNWLNTTDHYAYIVGYEDGEVKPNNNITRAEVATIFFRLLTDDARARYWSQTNDYTDVAADSWYNNAISTLSNMGIINGYEDGTFQPNASITRAEFTAIATRFFDYTAEYDGAFNDVSRSAWYADCVQAAVDMGLVDGYPDGGFHPNSNITRAEAVTIVNRVLNRAPHEDHLLDEDEMNVWPDNVYGAWYYADMQEATNSHDYDWIRVSGERVEEWTEKLPERDWAALEQEWSSAYSG